MDIKGCDEIIALLKEQAGLRSLENDEGGVLSAAADFIFKAVAELRQGEEGTKPGEEIFGEERTDIINTLPKRDDQEYAFNDDELNAWVYIGPDGRLNILFQEGGWLGIEPAYFTAIQADIAPFSD